MKSYLAKDSSKLSLSSIISSMGKVQHGLVAMDLHCQYRLESTWTEIFNTGTDRFEFEHKSDEERVSFQVRYL